MMAPVHPLSTYQIGTAMPGPVDKAKFKFKLKNCSPLYCISRLLVNLKSDIYAKKKLKLKLASLCSLMNLKKIFTGKIHQ